MGSGYSSSPGLPGVRLDPLCKLRNLSKLSDEEMVNIQRNNLLDSTSPNPSVETLLHAFLPHKFVDHAHATPFLILANLPDAREVCRKIFERLAIVPISCQVLHSQKRLLKSTKKNPAVEGLLLLNHGHFALERLLKKVIKKLLNILIKWQNISN